MGCGDQGRGREIPAPSYQLMEFAMKRKARQRTERLGSGGLPIAFAVAIFVLILLLRMMLFVAPHGRHH